MEDNLAVIHEELYEWLRSKGFIDDDESSIMFKDLKVSTICFNPEYGLDEYSTSLFGLEIYAPRYEVTKEFLTNLQDDFKVFQEYKKEIEKLKGYQKKLKDCEDYMKAIKLNGTN